MSEPVPEGELARLTESIVRFREARDWKQFHNPKDMALSLSLEVGEIFELMQWKNGAELDAALLKEKEELADELSDVLYWTLLLAHDLEVDLAKAFEPAPGTFERRHAIPFLQNPVLRTSPSKS